MKNNVIVLMVLTLALFASNSSAADKVKADKKVDAKCHIELIGGVQTIYFATVKSSQVSSMTKSLVNHKVSTTLSNKKLQVYKAFECVLLTDKFNSETARMLFEKTPR
jgi:hypothetical protein